MKFAWKIFFSTCILLVISLGVGSFLLVNNSFQTMLNARKTAALEKSISLSRSYQALLAADRLLSTNLSLTTTNTDSQLQTHVSNVNPFPETLSLGQLGSRLLQTDDGAIIFQVVCSLESPSGEPLYVESREDFSDIYQLRSNSQLMACFVVLGVCVISGSLAFWYSQRLTAPLNRLTKIAALLGQGDLSRRTPVVGSTQEITALSHSFNRMAEQVECQMQQLKEESCKRDEFVANFTHELKTPLTSIIGYADLMRSFDLDAPQRREYSDFIYREGSRLESLSLHLMDLIVLDQSERPSSPTSTRVILESVCRSLLPLMEKEGIQLVSKFTEETVAADATLIQTVVYNLADNARKAIEGPIRQIVLEGCRENDVYRITVSDTGTGIPADQLDHITEPFYMIDKSRARRQGGAGLGLALCQRIIHLHGSELHFVSHPGVGTSVSFVLPLLPSPQNQKGPTQ